MFKINSEAKLQLAKFYLQKRYKYFAIKNKNLRSIKYNCSNIITGRYKIRVSNLLKNIYVSNLLKNINN